MVIPKRLTRHIIALAAALLLTGCTGAYSPYSIPSDSMFPLIRDGERICVDESDSARTNLHDGDVISFRHGDNVIFKRILAMPGETISSTDRKVFRNGKQLDEPYLAPPSHGKYPRVGHVPRPHHPHRRTLRHGRQPRP